MYVKGTYTKSLTVAGENDLIINGNIVKQDGKLTYRDLSRRLTELERSSDRLYAGFASDASAAKRDAIFVRKLAKKLPVRRRSRAC